jgi:hypothetical protein
MWLWRCGATALCSSPAALRCSSRTMNRRDTENAETEPFLCVSAPLRLDSFYRLDATKCYVDLSHSIFDRYSRRSCA